MELKISKNQADAMRQDVADINGMQEIINQRIAANKRLLVDVIARDAGQDPEAFIARYEMKTAGSEHFLVLFEKPVEAPAVPKE